VVTAPQDIAAAFTVPQNRPGAVAAHIVEGAKRVFAVADHEDGPAGDGFGQIAAGFGQLIRASDHQPLAAENRVAFLVPDRRVRAIPGGGEGRGAVEFGHGGYYP
jgi:hypothetical protein